jgi:diguanylate cyclase (GGDEF)-like protein
MSAPDKAKAFARKKVTAAQRIITLENKFARERKARMEAEMLAERGLRDLFLQRTNVELLNRIADAANESNDPDALLAFAIREICQANGWPVANVLLRAGTANDPRLEACGISFAQSPDQAFGFMELSRRLIAWPCVTSPGKLLINPVPYWSHDIQDMRGFSRAREAASLNLRSSIAVPVMIGHELVAALEFFLFETNQPKPETLQLLSQIGTQIGRVFKRKRNHQQLMQTALSDGLTGLPNRTAFTNRLNEIYAYRRERGEPGPSLVFIDLDGFKLVNDTLGHQAGDMLLLELTNRLTRLIEEFRVAESAMLEVPDEIVLARMGGDEFTILVDGPDRVALANEIAEAIHKCLLPTYILDNNEITAAASIGVAHDDGHYSAPEELLRDADVAMYEAKSKGHSRTIIFDQNMRTTALERLKMEADLRQAIEGNEFFLQYQPIIALPSKNLVGFEALVRWRRASGEIIQPNSFIPVAEQSGLITVIGHWVLREACRAAGRVRKHMPSDSLPLYVSVNVAASQFLQPNFLDQVRAILMETCVDPRWVSIEATESAAIMSPAKTAFALNQLREWGMRVCLDDFGTGYSSLSHLSTMPVDAIKIDQSFIRHQTKKNADWNIVAAVMQLAKAMHLNVIAEGIESAYQSTYLAKLGCGFGQGYHFFRPMDEADAMALILQKASAQQKKSGHFT